VWSRRAQPRPSRSPAYQNVPECRAESRRLIESVVPEAHGTADDEKLDNTLSSIVGREKQ
jgi:hypothetical protein